MKMKNDMVVRNIMPVILLAAAGQMMLSCSNGGGQKQLEAAKSEFVAEKNIVDTMFLVRTDFSREIISNGNLRAVKKADMAFKSTGTVARVYKKDGDRVRKGDTIVVLDIQALKLKYEQSEIDMERAELDFADKLLGFGYNKDAAGIPEEILKVADIRSGYSSAKHSLASAKIDMDNASVVAPFDGIVANLSVKPYETPSETVCSIIDNSSFDVEFNLLESELNFIKVGQDVKVVPYIDLSGNYRGKIRQINPVIDENGQVKVVASIENKESKLIEGMNVKIFIESVSGNKLIVPKSAVVIRDGYDVLFALNKNSGTASWIYVDVLESNSTHHVVRGNKQKNAELSEGMTVIIGGNLNLADGSRVEIKNR